MQSRKKHTGRNLVLLNAGIRRDTLFKATVRSSVKLVHFSDYVNKPENFVNAFTEADGIFFEELKVAVVNFEKEDQIGYLNTYLGRNAVLSTEPERYLYKTGLKRRKRFNDGENASWGIKAVLAENSSFSGKGVRIAILDTGIFKEHADLKGRKIKTKKFVESGSAKDVDGHGTHCAGVACGFKDSNGFRYGVAYESEIFAGKVLNDQGEGTDGSILAGIEWALSEKCRVISMSLGAPAGIDESYSETYENVAKRAMKSGALIVAAAGNESNRPSYIAPVGHPANCPSILAVGAIDSNLKIAWFSCGGVNPVGGQVDIVAPGVSVYSLINVQNEHAKWDGTSMATPYVAGIAGMFCEQNKNASPLEVWSLITQHARRLKLSSIDAGSGLVLAPE
ncbi:MAG TPA: S8 family serine peptidase [Bacteroidales bacterium]|jgi:subtilisin family serine protease|nr:S8 family serine peptidase [Bacteroidales bacterium]